MELRNRVWNLENYIYCSTILYLINNIMVAVNKNIALSTVNQGCVLLEHFIMIGLQTAIVFSSLLGYSRIRTYFIDHDKTTSQYYIRLVILLIVHLLIQSCCYWNRSLYQTITIFLPGYVQILLFIGFIIPLVYEYMTLNKIDMSSCVLVLITILDAILIINHMQPLYMMIFIVLLFISLVLCTYRYHYSIFMNRMFIICMFILCVVLCLGFIYYHYDDYIINRLQDWLSPEYNTGYDYIRNLLTHSHLLGKSSLVNQTMLSEFYYYGLIGPSILYYLGWIPLLIYILFQCFYLGSIIHFIFISFKNKNINILLVILLIYVFIQLTGNVMGTLGMPILNVNSPFVDVKNDFLIAIMIIGFISENELYVN